MIKRRTGLQEHLTHNLVTRTVHSSQQNRKRTARELERSDAITVVLCGTGSPMPSKRTQSCTAVFVGGQFLVFDVGDGAARSMEALNLPVAHIQGMFLTHFHSDHFADLGEAIDRSWVNGRHEPLSIYGPQGITEIVNGFLAAYQKEYGYRTAHHGPEIMPPQYAGAIPYEFEAPVDDDPVEVYNHNGVIVKAFKVNHPPVIPAVGYRIEYAGKLVVITGDTTATDTLITNSRNADLLVSEVMNMDIIRQIEVASRRGGFDHNAHIMHDIREYHMDVSDVGNIAQQAQVKRLALTHLIPPLDNDVQVNRFFKQPIQKLYHGEIFVGKDGMRIVISLT